MAKPLDYGTKTRHHQTASQPQVFPGKPFMSSFAIMLWLLNLFFDTTGHRSFKVAATVADTVHGVQRWRCMIRDKWIWIVVLAFVFEFQIWVVFLSVVPLSVGVLMGSFYIIGFLVLMFSDTLTQGSIKLASRQAGEMTMSWNWIQAVLHQYWL